MNSSIKIIKRKQAGESSEVNNVQEEKTVEENTREMVSTVKNWIAELKQRKSAQGRGFSPLPIVASESVSQNG